MLPPNKLEDLYIKHLLFIKHTCGSLYFSIDYITFFLLWITLKLTLCRSIIFTSFSYPLGISIYGWKKQRNRGWIPTIDISGPSSLIFWHPLVIVSTMLQCFQKFIPFKFRKMLRKNKDNGELKTWSLILWYSEQRLEAVTNHYSLWDITLCIWE